MVLGIGVRADVGSGEIDAAAFRTAAEHAAHDYHVGEVAVTLRVSRSASDNAWSALLWDAAHNPFHHSQRYGLRVVDRIGGGDSFAAGLIYGLGSGGATVRALRCAAAASVIKRTIPGDFNRASVKEAEALAAGGGSDRVQR